LPRARAALEVDRPRLAQLVRRGHASGKHGVGAPEHLARARRALVEPCGLALGQLPDALAVKLDEARLDGHVGSLGLSLDLRFSRRETPGCLRHTASAANRRGHPADARPKPSDSASGRLASTIYRWIRAKR